MNRRHFLVLALSLAAGVFTPIQGAPKSSPRDKDPILGKWIFHGEHRIAITADGKAISHKGSNGVWRFLSNPEVERRYEIVWDEGLFIDSVRLSRDGKTLQGKNQKGRRIHAVRAPEIDK